MAASMHDEWRCGPQVGGFMRVRRALLSVLSDAAYDTVQSFHSDSAVAFSIFLHHLPDLTQQHPPHVLLRAMEVSVLFSSPELTESSPLVNA